MRAETFHIRFRLRLIKLDRAALEVPIDITDTTLKLDREWHSLEWNPGSRPRRPKDAVLEEETVTLGALHEEIFLRRSHFLGQCPKRIAKSIQLLRIMLIHGYITAELCSAHPVGSTGVLAPTNGRAFKCPSELTKRDRG